MSVKSNRKLIKRYLDLEYDYECWIQENESTKYKKIKGDVLFSVVIVDDCVLPERKKRALDSVKRQNYKNYEIIEWNRLEKDWKDVKDNLHGAYTIFLYANDWISPNALQEIYSCVGKKSDVVWIYSDEDIFRERDKKRVEPYYKFTWSKETFLSNGYTGSLSAYETDLCKKIDAWDEGFSFRFLSLLEDDIDEDKIVYIEKVLYHKSDEINKAEEKRLEEIRNAKQDYITKQKIDATLELEERTKQERFVYTPSGKVSIIIPSKDNVVMLKACIESIENNTGYLDYEIIVVDNGSNEENKGFLEHYLRAKNSTYLYKQMEFNFSTMCNMGAKSATGEYLLFLNDDIECFDAKWLSRMLGQANQKGIGAVGAKLLYPDRKSIQHAGIEEMKTGPSHVLTRKADEGVLEHGKNCLDYNYDAVTAACLLISKINFEETGGFDETFPISYNDVDLCYSLREKGLRNVVRTDAILLHHESVSRGLDAKQKEKMDRLLQERRSLYHKHPWVVEKKDDEFVSEETFARRYVEADFSVSIDEIRYGDLIKIRGWFWFMNDEITNLSDAFVVFKDNKKEYWYKTKKMIREDVVETIKNSAYGCGFVANIPIEDKQNLAGCEMFVCVSKEWYKTAVCKKIR